jgi:hypothetical protein
MATVHLDHRNEQTGQLISGVLSDARDLAVAEVDKLKAEAITRARGVGEEAKLFGAGVFLLVLGAVLLAAAIALGLIAAGLPAWAGFGVVAIASGVPGAVLVKHKTAAATAARTPVA